jgi:hypothetical protein
VFSYIFSGTNHAVCHSSVRKLLSLRIPDMEPDALAEMKKPGISLRAPVFPAFSWQPPSIRLSPSALALKVTFHSLDIFLPRSKLRCMVKPGMPGIFLRIIFS